MRYESLTVKELDVHFQEEDARKIRHREWWKATEFKRLELNEKSTIFGVGNACFLGK
jgi:hypothetical protein